MRYQLGWLFLLSSAFGTMCQTIGVNRLVCGRRKFRSVYLIHNGIDARIGHWPWHATIFQRKDSEDEYSCGATIIDEDTILTSAHCVFAANKLIPANRLSVHVGSILLTDPGEYEQVHWAREIIVHPGFKARRFVHDIALIKLATNITMTKFVQPVCLWTMDSNQELIVGRNGTVLGFGLTELDRVSEQLKQASVGVVDTLTCIANDRAAFGTQLTPEMFCAGGQEGVSACNGDSGGGLFLEIGGKWFVRGIVSFIPTHKKTGLCDTSKFTAFTDVAKYMGWIEEYINPNVLVFDTDDYDVDFEEKLSLVDLSTCGVSSTTFLAEKLRSTTPWLGNAVLYPSFYSRCAVTLISEWYAVGPARCFENSVNELRIRMGDYKEQKNSTCFDRDGTTVCTTPSQTLQIHRIIIHPRYNRKQFTDNIALIELLTPVDTTQPNARPICLPIVKELYTNKTTDLSVISFSSSNRSFEGKAINYVNESYCQRAFAGEGLTLSLKEKRICGLLSAQDQTDCVPLKTGMALQERVSYGASERYVLRGFDGFALTCEKESVPIVYINLYAYLDWILYNMRDNEFDESAAESTIEAKWKRLQQEEGKEKLRSFDMESCGESISVQGTAQLYTYMPWIGTLEGNEDPLKSPSRLTSKVVLISAWYALAPAHAFSNRVLWRSITLGYHDRILELRCAVLGCDPPYQEIQIKQVLIHPDYDGAVNVNNIALIELMEPANMTKPFISPICLPFMQEFQTSSPIELTLSMSLLETRRVIRLSALNCQARLIHRRHFVFNQEIPMCADEYESGAERFVDHPGAALQATLFFADRKRHFLHGISFLLESTRAGNAELPYLFTDTSLHLDWILEGMDFDRERNVSWNDRIPVPSRMNRLPVRLARSKGRLLNFNTCGLYSNNSEESFAREPWLGVIDAWDPKSKSNQYTDCAVTLISDSYALGPARCLNHEVNGSFVELGGYKRYVQDCNDENCRIQSIPIEKIVLHPNYNPANQENNIALVQLATPADITKDNVKPICLPVQDEIRSYDVSSMALSSLTSSSRAYVTKSIGERYIDSTECQRRWDGLSVEIAIKNTTLCTLLPKGLGCYDIRPGFALHTTHDLAGKARRFLRGIKTEQPEGCSEYYPIVYTDVDLHLDWILENMNVTGNGQTLEYDLTDQLIFV
ncbi:uncharacterized protein LOC126567821 [Anopheles maculipalpis]|uniref:uncharacterized protein LOC126567821 n=1 Tax=Anopheles maculipalpis TaxID=1496333 RepID=UPI0021595491|nr:uncharacterized protein LOC126567821 [Anopheles maculipalpis]